MFLRYPGMVQVGHGQLDVAHVLDLRPVYRDVASRSWWCAPKRVAWLYRRLPSWVGWMSDEDQAAHGAYICAGVSWPSGTGIGVVRAEQADGLREPYLFVHWRMSWSLVVGPGRLSAGAV